MARQLTPNTPLKRFEYIAKLYGEKHPARVLDTFAILADTAGIEHPEREFEFFKRFEFYGRNPVPGLAAKLLDEALVELRSDPRMTRRSDADALWPWVTRQLIRSEGQDLAWAVESLRGKGTALALWQQRERIDLGKWTLFDVLDALEDFEIAHKPIPQGRAVYSWPDGWTIQQLDIDENGREMDIQESLEAEGEAMQNCVATYADLVQTHDAEIYSLRDPNGRPHVTIEYQPQIKRVVQVMGKQNEKPTAAYQKRVDEFVASGALTVHPTDKLTDMERAIAAGWGERVAQEGFSDFEDGEYWTIVDIPPWDEYPWAPPPGSGRSRSWPGGHVSDDGSVDEEVWPDVDAPFIPDRLRDLTLAAAEDAAFDWWAKTRTRLQAQLDKLRDRAIAETERAIERGEIKEEEDIHDFLFGEKGLVTEAGLSLGGPDEAYLLESVVEDRDVQSALEEYE